MIITGLARLGRDAELRYLPDSTPVAALALAYNYGRKESDSRPTQWIDASMYGEHAKTLAPYLLKGQNVDVVLEDVHVEQYTRRDNTVAAALRGRVLRIELAGKAPERTAGTTQQGQQAPAPQPPDKNPQNPGF